jgi:hypothetical protein
LSESLIKLIFKGLPTKEKIAIKVGSATLCQVERIYAVATFKVYIKIGSIIIDTILNSRVEVNIIIRLLVNKARLTI